MLQGNNLYFRYSRRGPWILNGVNIELRPGEVVGLRGQSGEGKTTLAKILAGYTVPIMGRVLVNGSTMIHRGYRCVQLMFQHPELTINPHFSIRKALEESGATGDALQEIIEGLEIDASWLARFPHELSGGELQRVALARALGQETRYLIADEMTAMLDSVTQAKLWGYLLSTVERRRLGVLAISHDVALLNRVAHRTLDLGS